VLEFGRALALANADVFVGNKSAASLAHRKGAFLSLSLFLFVSLSIGNRASVRISNGQYDPESSFSVSTLRSRFTQHRAVEEFRESRDLRKRRFMQMNRRLCLKTLLIIFAPKFVMSESKTGYGKSQLKANL